MVLRPTGPGKIDQDTSYSEPMAKALMYNFDIDGADLKHEHVNFLQSHAVPLLRNNRGAIWMQGSASQSGAAPYNLALSRRRVESVKAALGRQGVQAEQIQANAVGESLAFRHAREDERDRAVAFVILPYASSLPPPRQVPAPVATNTRFKIRMHANLNASVIAGVDYSIFEIWDVQAGHCSFYQYFAGGISGGVLDGSWLSATMRGPWNDMTTSGPIAANQFGGPARFTTGGGGPWSYNVVNFMGLPGDVRTVPNPFRMDTGFTIGLGGGTSVGRMELVYVGTPDGLLPYRGDRPSERAN
ncbi:MAG: OmpA family protein [Pseudomonadota bacterium]